MCYSTTYYNKLYYDILHYTILHIRNMIYYTILYYTLQATCARTLRGSPPPTAGSPEPDNDAMVNTYYALVVLVVRMYYLGYR